MLSFKQYIKESGDNLPYKGDAFKIYDKITAKRENPYLTYKWYPYAEKSNDVAFLYFTDNRGYLTVFKFSKIISSQLGFATYKLTSKGMLDYISTIWSVSTKDFKEKLPTQSFGEKFIQKVYNIVLKSSNSKQITNLEEKIEKIFQEM